MVRNTIEVDIVRGDKVEKVGFKCGTLAIAIACREAGVKDIQTLFLKMAEKDLLAILALFYGSACQYSGRKDLTMDMVSDYLEDMGEENAKKVTAVLLEMFKPKNHQAPQEGANPQQ